MHIHDIQAFLVVTQTRNISRAADILHLSQTAVTHRLQNLEEELGVTLLDRGRGIKEISITPSGQDFIYIARRWNALWDEMERFKKQGEKLSLSFGAVQQLNDFVFPPLFMQLFNHTPKINLELHTEHTSELFPLVEQRLVDVAIVWRKFVLPNIVCTPWKEVPMVLLKRGNAKHAGSVTAETSKLDTNKELYVPWTPDFNTWHNLMWPTGFYNPIHITGAPLVIRLIREGGYWSIVPLWMAEYAITLGGLTYNLLSNPPEPLTAYIVTHKYPRPSTEKALKVFFDYLDKFKI